MDNVGISPYGLSFIYGDFDFPSSVKTLLNYLFKASAFSVISLMMFPAMWRSHVPWLSCLSLQMKLQNGFGFSVPFWTKS